MIDLDALEALEKKATPRPWCFTSRQGDDFDSVVFTLNTPNEICQCFHNPDNVDECSANTELIATIRNALPELIALARDGERWRIYTELMDEKWKGILTQRLDERRAMKEGR